MDFLLNFLKKDEKQKPKKKWIKYKNAATALFFEKNKAKHK